MSRKTPGEVRARTCGTKSPSRSEAMRFIDSSKSPSTKIDGSMANFRRRLSNRHGRPRRMLIWTFEGLCLELSFSILYCRTQANLPTLLHAMFAENGRCTRENEHPRKRAPDHTTPAYSDTEAKFSSQTQPRKCAPTANLDTQLTAFCTRSTFCTRCSKPVADFWLQIWLILRVWHTSRSESASAQNQCLAYSSFSSCSLFEFSPFQKKMHMISPSGIAVHVHTTLPGWCHFQNSCRVWNTGVLFVFLISCIALSLQFLASQQNEKIKQKLRLPADKSKKEIIMKMKRHSE